MKNIVFLSMSLLFAFGLQAQTKIFKEVGEEISTQIQAITQENGLVGYLAFTRLEKADADSFNYRITVMDNPEIKTHYMIIDDEKHIYIYNVNSQKLERTIQHKDGNVKTTVYPAKEGHIMVSEYNRKEKYTRFSIEGLH